jgi:hypothetical protein
LRSAPEDMCKRWPVSKRVNSSNASRGSDPDPRSFLAALSSGQSNSNGHAYEHWASTRRIRAHRRPGGRGKKPSPPTATGPGRRQLTFQSCGFFTSRHGKVGQRPSLGHERV